MKTLTELLTESAALHRHLCPRQVLGVQMGRWAAELLDLDLPQQDKRLLTFVETDGCFCDGVAVAAGCWVGRRTLRVEDYGKVAATFVDTQTERALRIAPHPQARQLAHRYAPEARNKWEAMLLGYQRMAPAELFVAQVVELIVPVSAIVSQAGHRVNCDRCGEEILNEREILRNGLTLCRACVQGAYYRVACQHLDPHSTPVGTSDFRMFIQSLPLHLRHPEPLYAGL
jgi:formylmethanofuran dehydrogenase subunit E